MPFTPSHAVVALPFVRTPLVPAAIAVGAMAPDVPLFLPGLPLGYGRTHDLVWLPATILVALVLLLIWRCVLRPAASGLAPVRVARRLPEEWDRGAAAALRETIGVGAVSRGGRARRTRVRWPALGLLTASLALGVVSHIVWDLFTHEGRWGVEVVPALDRSWGPLTGYKLLQHGSSVLGLMIIVVWAVVRLVRADARATIRGGVPSWVRVAWWLSLPAVLLTAWVIGHAAGGPFDTEYTPAHLAYRVLPTACALWGAATVILASAVQVRRHMTRSDGGVPRDTPGGRSRFARPPDRA